MTINDLVLTGWQKTVFTLCDLYAGAGYAPFRMGKFEEYDLYARNREFLISDNVLTFTDPGGRLMALKPDVTLSVIKNSADTPDRTQRFFYSENVYRGRDSFREIFQAGLECFGKVGVDEISEVIALAVRSLEKMSANCALEISCPDVIEELVEKSGVDSAEIKNVYKAIGEKNAHAIRELCPGAETLISLIKLHGSIDGVRAELDRLLCGLESYNAFCEILDTLSALPESGKIIVDFSLTGDSNYYNGIIFKGFLAGVPEPVLSGGRYDRLMRRMKRVSGAVGFAVYTDDPERLTAASSTCSDEWLNVALPKGRLGEKVYDMFARAGFECPAILEPNRKLVFENPEKKVRYFWVKPADVAIYVERGAADIGVVGKDVLLETNPDIYELLDLKTGICRMAVAAPKGYTENTQLPLRVATKFSEIAKRYYFSKGRDIDIIHLNGSIEIAPLLGLSDVIVDIVETGTTLRENNLEVIETVLPISARLIANKAAFKFKPEPIERLAAGLSGIVEEAK